MPVLRQACSSTSWRRLPDRATSRLPSGVTESFFGWSGHSRPSSGLRLAAARSRCFHRRGGGAPAGPGASVLPPAPRTPRTRLPPPTPSLPQCSSIRRVVPENERASISQACLRLQALSVSRAAPFSRAPARRIPRRLQLSITQSPGACQHPREASTGTIISRHIAGQRVSRLSLSGARVERFRRRDPGRGPVSTAWACERRCRRPSSPPTIVVWVRSAQ